MDKYELMKVNLRDLRRIAIDRRMEKKEMYLITGKSKMQLINYILQD